MLCQIERASLRAAGIDVVEFTEVKVEPSDRSCLEAAAFMKDAGADGMYRFLTRVYKFVTCCADKAKAGGGEPTE